MTRDRAQRGTTLIELVVVLALSAVLIGMVIVAMIDLDRTRKPREVSAQVQGEGRSGLSLIENDLRLASLGAGTGTVFLSDGFAPTELPMVQIIDDLPAVASTGTVPIRAKQGTDAILIVRAAREDSAAVTADRYGAGEMASVPVHGPSKPFVRGDRLLLGDYGNATWGVVDGVHSDGPGHSTLSLLDARIPSRTLTKLAAGAFARRAVARLYFVSPEDELVRVDLSSPRLIGTVGISNREVIACPNTTGAGGTATRACGIENLQIDCALDNGVGPQPCPGPIFGALADNAAGLFSVTFGAGTGPRLSADAAQETISQLRTVSLSLVVRSGTPLIDTHGDPKISLDGATPLPVGAQPDTGEYVRRAYQVTVAARNTSLGVM